MVTRWRSSAQPADRVQWSSSRSAQVRFDGIGLYTRGDPDGPLGHCVFSGHYRAAGVCSWSVFCSPAGGCRLQGIYLAVATFALAIAMPQSSNRAARTVDRVSRASHPEARPSRWACRSMPISGSITSRDRPSGHVRRATTWSAATGRASWRSATTRSPPHAMASTRAL